MIDIKELRISNDGNYLYIKASVKTDSYFSNVYIDKVIIDTGTTYSESGPSSTPVYSTTLTGNQKEVSLILSKTDFTFPATTDNLQNNLFMVYLVAKGSPSSNTPCGLDNVNTLGVTLAMCTIYPFIMQSINEVEQTCDVPENFIDTMLKFEAINVSVDSGHYTKAIQLYDKYFKNFTDTSTITCSCNG